MEYKQFVNATFTLLEIVVLVFFRIDKQKL